MTDKDSLDDKTQIAPRRQTKDAISNNTANNHPTPEDKTVIKQRDDKTRIAPRRQMRDATSGSEPNSELDSELSSEPDSDATITEADDRTQVAPTKDNRQENVPSRSNNSAEETSSTSTNSRKKAEKIINNRFVLQESLGVGGMAMVYRALDLRKQETGDSDPYIAIKILSREFEEHPQAFISLQREAKKSQILSHPNVIKVYDFDREGDLVYLTMEELRGRPLKKLIREYSQGMPLKMAIPIIQAISDGLAYAHKKNIVHADLKPDNIFYTDDGEVKIIDFGIARIMTDLDAKGSSAAQDDPDELVGLTPSYASLEMLNYEAPIPSDDIYALGIIAYELLTGRHPFKSEQADVAFDKEMSFKKINHIKSYQWKAIASSLSFEHKDRLKNAEVFRDLFSGKGRTVRGLIAGLVTLALVFAVSLFIPRNTNTDHLYDDLTPVQQVKFDELMKEGNALLGFNDWNNALSMFEQAHEVLPLHSTTQASLNDAVKKIIDSFEDKASNLSSERKLTQVNQLLKYKSLTDNERLLKYKAQLESNLN